MSYEWVILRKFLGHRDVQVPDSCRHSEASTEKPGQSDREYSACSSFLCFPCKMRTCSLLYDQNLINQPAQMLNN